MSENLTEIFLNKNEIFNEIKLCNAGYKTVTDIFFDDGNKIINNSIKWGVLSLKNDQLHAKNPVKCNFKNCNKSFATLCDFDEHYKQFHSFKCIQCKQNLPSQHLLDLHLSEKHDSFFAVQIERKPMYSCFIEECNIKNWTPMKRRNHCIQVHNFPNKFHYKYGFPSVKEKKNENENDIAELSSKFKKIQFGHNQAKAFNINTQFKKREKINNKQNDNTEKMSSENE